MRTTFNICFVCRPSKVQKSGLAPVEMTIVINGARTYLALPRKEQPSTFKKLTESKKPNELKEYLQGVYNKVSQKSEKKPNHQPYKAIEALLRHIWSQISNI